MKINFLSRANEYPGQGVCSAHEDYMHILEKSNKFKVYSNSHKVIPAIQHSHLFDFGSYWLLHKNKKKSLNVVSAHVLPESVKGSFKLASLWAPYFNIYLRWYYETADVILAVSYEVARLLESKLGLPSEKIIVFRNFVRSDLFYNSDTTIKNNKLKYRKKLGLPLDRFVVMSSGQLQKRKGIYDFIEIANKMPDTTFLWVGGMPFEGATHNYKQMKAILENHPPNVIMTGTVDRSLMSEYFIAADMFFLPSYHETFGLVVIEAMGSGLPVLLRDLLVYKDIFNSAYTSGNTNEEFIQLIKKLKEDSQFYSSLKNKSRNLFPCFDSDNALEELLKIYNNYYEKKFQRGIPKE